MPRTSNVLAADALLGMLLPFWQLVIGVLVLFAVGASVQRLARRGHSRMSTGLLVTGGAIAGIALLSLFLQD